MLLRPTYCVSKRKERRTKKKNKLSWRSSMFLGMYSCELAKTEQINVISFLKPKTNEN